VLRVQLDLLVPLVRQEVLVRLEQLVYPGHLEPPDLQELLDLPGQQDLRDSLAVQAQRVLREVSGYPDRQELPGRSAHPDLPEVLAQWEAQVLLEVLEPLDPPASRVHPVQLDQRDWPERLAGPVHRVHPVQLDRLAVLERLV